MGNSLKDRMGSELNGYLGEICVLLMLVPRAPRGILLSFSVYILPLTTVS